MKTKFKIISIAIAIFCIFCIPKKLEAQPAVSFQVFYDQLSPYGTWLNDPQYGYVWIPSTGASFSPYGTNGYWINTEYGWTWVSGYSWGWAPFHYGRWENSPQYGWFWIPGTEWGPAWVYWRESPGYYGWAPMGYASADYYSDYNRWCFVHDYDFGRHNPTVYIVPRKNYPVIIQNSRLNRPDVVVVEKATSRKFNPVSVAAYGKPGQYYANNKLYIYRPEMSKAGKPSKPVDPANYGGVRQSQKTVNPGNYGGMNQSTSPNVKSRTAQPKTVNPANYGGVKQKAVQPRSTAPNPSNYGGVKQPSPTIQQRQAPQPVQQPKPNPSNYGGMKQQAPAPVIQQRQAPEPVQRQAPAPNPANYGGMKQSAPAPQPQRPNPANYGGVKK